MSARRSSLTLSVCFWFLTRGWLFHGWLMSGESGLSPHVIFGPNIAKNCMDGWEPTLVSTLQYPLAPRESHSRRRTRGRGCTPSHPAPCPGLRAFTPPTQSAPGLNSITQEGTLKNPHLWLMLWFCGLKRQRRRKELLGAITMEPLYCLARAWNDNWKPHYWLADS